MVPIEMFAWMMFLYFSTIRPDCRMFSPCGRGNANASGRIRVLF